MKKFAPSPTFVVFLLSILFFLLSFLSMLDLSPTYDESIHILYGQNILKGDTSRLMCFPNEDGVTLCGSSMPITAMNAAFGSGFTARLVSIFISLLTALLLFYWTRSLYGVAAAFTAFLLYILDPNLIAFSQVVGTDMYAWAATLLAFYCAWRFGKGRSMTNLILMGLSLGLALAVKYTTIVFPLLIFSLLFLQDQPALSASWKENRFSGIVPFLKKQAAYMGTTLFIAWVVLCAAFLFEGMFVRFGEYKFNSQLMRGIQSNVPAIADLPVPTPRAYLEGFDTTYYYGEKGEAYGSIYLFGELREGTNGFGGYYFVASLFKTPIATQAVIFLSFVIYLSDPNRRKRFISDESFILIPILFFAFYFNFLFNINIGIRYYLIFFPLLYVFCGGVFSGWADFSKQKKYASTALFVYLGASTLLNFPNYIPYFNEFMPDRKMAYTVLADSNIDYGQGEFKAAAYKQANPNAIWNPEKPVAGMVVMSVNELTGVRDGAEKFAWIRENFKPKDTISNIYLVYEISQDEINSLCATTEYCR